MEKIIEKVAMVLHPELKQIAAKVEALERQADLSQQKANAYLKRGDVQATALQVRETTLLSVAAKELRDVEMDIYDATGTRIMYGTLAVAIVTLLLVLLV